VPAKQAAVAASTSRYILMEGDVLGHNHQPVDAFHMDVYEIREDGKRTLARTGHYPSSHYRLHLERGYAYELIVEAIGYQTKHFYVEATGTEVAPIAMRLQSRAVAALPQIAQRSMGVIGDDQPKLPNWHPLPELPKKDSNTAEAGLAEAEESEPQPTPVASSNPLSEAKLVAAYNPPKQATAELARTPRLGKTRAAVPLLRSLRPGDRTLLKLPANATIDVLEYTTPDWWMVAYEGEMGWVRAQDVR
jgi:hypothetical protein